MNVLRTGPYRRFAQNLVLDLEIAISDRAEDVVRTLAEIRRLKEQLAAARAEHLEIKRVLASADVA
jgi:hypothetical protein